MKKLIAFLLCLTLVGCALIACNKQTEETPENTPQLNQDLLNSCKDFWTEENKNIAIDLVKDAEAAYATYQENKDLDAYANAICATIDKNQAFINEVAAALESAKANVSDEDAKAIFLLKLNMLNIAPRRQDILLITDPSYSKAVTDAEFEKTVHSATNAVTYAFCGTEPAK